MKKNTFISGIIFGVIFIALGVFLFTLKGESTIILLIAIADIVFGLALLAGGVVSMRKAPADGLPAAGPVDYNEAYDKTYKPSGDRRGERRDFEDQRDRRRHAGNDDSDFDDFADDSTVKSAPDFYSMSPSELRAEEQRLRAEARRSSAEAQRTLDEANDAIDQAKRAEQALERAQDESRYLSGAEKQNALRNIDRLAQQATALSHKASEAKQRARAAHSEAQRISVLHSQAVEAAAVGMDDDF